MRYFLLVTRYKVHSVSHGTETIAYRGPKTWKKLNSHNLSTNLSSGLGTGNQKGVHVGFAGFTLATYVLLIKKFYMCNKYFNISFILYFHFIY